MINIPLNYVQQSYPILVNLILRDYTLLNPIYTNNEEILCA